MLQDLLVIMNWLKALGPTSTKSLADLLVHGGLLRLDLENFDPPMYALVAINSDKGVHTRMWRAVYKDVKQAGGVCVRDTIQESGIDAPSDN